MMNNKKKITTGSIMINNGYKLFWYNLSKKKTIVR